MLRAAVFTLLALGFAAPAIAVDRQVPDSTAAVQLSFAPVVKRVAPAVVNVYASRTVQDSGSPFFSDPFFRQLFGDQFGGQPSTRIQQSLGSGVIINSSGLIVTNYHVIEGADEVKVALSDKREFPADIVLKDQRTDLAVLRITGNAGNLPVIDFADSDQVEVGDLVLAIGDPFGVGQTVTSGIVSALARAPDGSTGDQYFIQTDAAINRGNSGGALVDMDGRLIGINSMIVSPSGGSIGLGFAIPSNVVRVVAAAAESGKPPERPWLGADLQAVTPEIAAGLGIDAPRGALVTSVDSDSPAANAGLKTGDLIVSIDGEDVDDPGAVTYRLATKPLGGSAALGIVRDGKAYTATVALAAAPETVPRDQRVIAGDSPLAGLTVLNLSPAVADELSYHGEPKGVVVSDVADGSNASEIGFIRGDIIAKVNDVTIDSTAKLASVAGGSSRSWDLTIKRNGRTIQQRFSG